MDIEKIIAAMRESVDLMQRDHMDMDFSLGEEGVSLTGNEARALLTEIDYWRARCGKAEKAIYWSDNSDLAEETNKDWQDAVSNEVRKAAYLKEINAPVEPFTYPLGDTVNVPLAAS